MVNKPIDANVMKLSTPDVPERDTAQDLVNKVMEEKRLWIAAWHSQLVDPSKAAIEEMPADAVGCSPGSCVLKSGPRLIAKFVVRFKEEPIGCEIEADWPSRPADEESGSLTEVLYEHVDGRIAFACEELALEGWAPDVDEMKRKLQARYGFRFSFRCV